MANALSCTARRQWANTYRNDDTGNYYVNVYFDFGEGFNRRETVKEEMTERNAERLANALNRAAKHLGNYRN